jgi:hypothetical protein
MPKYKIKERSFIGNRLVEEGEEIEYQGKPGSSLHPLDEEAQQAVLKARGGKAINTQPDPDEAELADLRVEYETLFGTRPHHFKKVAALRKEIADKLAEKEQQ